MRLIEHRLRAVQASLEMFGWAIDGDVREVSAHVAEGYEWQIPRLQWDRDQQWLSGVRIFQYGEDEREVRPWAALPWITEHCLRRHMAWPGL